MGLASQEVVLDHSPQSGNVPRMGDLHRDSSRIPKFIMGIECIGGGVDTKRDRVEIVLSDQNVFRGPSVAVDCYGDVEHPIVFNDGPDSGVGCDPHKTRSKVALGLRGIRNSRIGIDHVFTGVSRLVPPPLFA